MAIPVYKIKNWEKKGKVKKLIKALSDQDKLVRWTAARALGEIGEIKKLAWHLSTFLYYKK